MISFNEFAQNSSNAVRASYHYAQQNDLTRDKGWREFNKKSKDKDFLLKWLRVAYDATYGLRVDENDKWVKKPSVVIVSPDGGVMSFDKFEAYENSGGTITLNYYLMKNEARIKEAYDEFKEKSINKDFLLEWRKKTYKAYASDWL